MKHIVQALSMFLTALLKAIIIGPSFSGDWEVSMLFSHIISSRISAILLGITSNNKYLKLHQATANLCLNYRHLLTSIVGKKEKKILSQSLEWEHLLNSF